MTKADSVYITPPTNTSAIYDPPMFLKVGRKRYPIATFAQASQMFCIVRDKAGEGASSTPSPLIVDEAGSVIGHVSYNGRVWPGATWTADAKPLFDNRAAPAFPQERADELLQRWHLARSSGIPVDRRLEEQ